MLCDFGAVGEFYTVFLLYKHEVCKVVFAKFSFAVYCTQNDVQTASPPLSTIMEQLPDCVAEVIPGVCTPGQSRNQKSNIGDAASILPRQSYAQACIWATLTA